MSEQEINIKKELARVKMAERNRLPHRKEARRKIEIAKAKTHKVERTAKRCSEHTMDELLAIMRKKCIIANIDFDKYQDRIQLVLHILHEDVDVFNTVGTGNILVPPISSENLFEPS